jgi:hypothetical protein
MMAVIMAVTALMMATRRLAAAEVTPRSRQITVVLVVAQTNTHLQEAQEMLEVIVQ